jgi:hypothetical protein
MCTLARWVLKRGERRKKYREWENETGCDPRVTNDTDFFSIFFGGWKHKKIEISLWVHVLNSTKQKKTGAGS